MNEFIEFIKSNLELIYILILAIFIGVEVIKNIPAVLHTPLMSGANALSGVVIVGAILVIIRCTCTRIYSRGIRNDKCGRRFCSYQSNVTNV